LIGKIDENGACVIKVCLVNNGVKTEPLRALIDTGSYYNLAQVFSIPEDFKEVVGKAQMVFLGGAATSGKIYECEAELPELGLGCKFYFTTFPHTEYASHYDVILGTSFLSRMSFAYNNPGIGDFSLNLIHIPQ
jgi:hypothetical protein